MVVTYPTRGSSEVEFLRCFFLRNLALLLEKPKFHVGASSSGVSSTLEFPAEFLGSTKKIASFLGSSKNIKVSIKGVITVRGTSASFRCPANIPRSKNSVCTCFSRSIVTKQSDLRSIGSPFFLTPDCIANRPTKSDIMSNF